MPPNHPRKQKGEKGYTAQQKEDRRLQVAENDRKKQEARNETAALKALWPPLGKEYEPEIWSNHYLNETYEFDLSKAMLQEIEGISEQEAERKLVEMMLKVTLIEANLANNGQQSVEKLWESLKSAMKEGQTFLFTSIDDLSGFLHSMVPVFRKTANTWQNTGCQSRRFCQWLYTRLKQGDVLTDDNFDESYEKFKDVIQGSVTGNLEDDKALENYAEKEMMLDFSSYWFLAAQVPGFEYANETLSLTPEADHRLPLRLPIFTNTLNSYNPFKYDYSRPVTGFVCTYSILNRKSFGYIPNGPLEGAKTITYRDRFEKAGKKGHGTGKMITVAKGYVCPNNPHHQLELFKLESTRLDFSKNLVGDGQNVYQVSDQGVKKLELNFDVMYEYLKRLRENVETREFVDYKKESIQRREDKIKKMGEEVEKDIENKKIVVDQKVGEKDQASTSTYWDYSLKFLK